MTDVMVVLVTVPDAAAAEKLAEALVGEGLAACVNIVPQVRSIYRWKGAVERDDELICLVKTTRDGLARVQARIVALHPYEVPEVIAVPIEAGHAAYLAWVAASITAPRE